LQQLGDLKIFVEASNKRMSKGMKVVSPAVRILKFDASNSDFLHVDALLPQDENRDGDVSA
jgi:hypothetical protein